jgi:ABC-type antimicrobial peptide transport system permease subunit
MTAGINCVSSTPQHPFPRSGVDSINDSPMSSNHPSPAARLSHVSMIAAGVRYNWRTSLAVALGVAIATSVIVGALVVGDSMRGSLRELTSERLGKVDTVVAPGGFFAADRAAETLDVAPENLATIILFDRAVAESTGGRDNRLAGAVQVIGCDEAFWQLDASGIAPDELPGDDSVVLTRSLAEELGVDVGDQVTVRLPVEQAVPADSPLGRRDVATEGIPRLTVADILPDRGLARFSLTPAQSTPKNVFLSRELVAEVLEREGQANVALSTVPIDADQISVALDDLGLKLKRVTETFDGETIFDYYSLTSDRLMLDQAAVDAVTAALPEGSVTPVMTYLANAIERAEADPQDEFPAVVYSTIAAMNSTDALPLDFDPPGVQLPPDHIPVVINSWTADRLSAEPGTRLKITYFEPEVEGGMEVEESFPAVVTEVVPITRPKREYTRRREAEFDQPPTRYNDPNLTPTVPGVTDQDSMYDWETPFELTREVPEADDQYWREHRLTPKAFIPLDAGRRLFASRFGQTTGLRIDTSVAANTDELAEQIRRATTPALDRLGWSPRPIRSMQLAASRGTTPFDGLFLSLSFFVIFAAVMLIAMLFRLGLVARSKELGTLLAMGLPRKQVARIFLGEGLVVAVLGVALGIAGGIGYAVAVLAALRTFWVGAVTVPFLTYHSNPTSLVIGGLVGLVIGVATLWGTLRSMMKNQAISLLRGSDDQQTVLAHPKGPASGARRPWLNYVAALMVLMAVGLGIAGSLSGGQTAAGSFVGGGMLLLFAILILVYRKLKVAPRQTAAVRRYSLARLSRTTAARAPLRSTLTIGLMATASFLIVAITAFRLQPTDEGTGGFDLVGDSAQPLYEDITTAETQTGLFGSDQPLIGRTTIASFRMRSGQDASCNNLYQATEPTVLGVRPGDAEKLAEFRFYASAAPAGQTAWERLDEPAAGTAEDPIPLILDQNTAMWSLQMVGGIGQEKQFTYDNQPIHFRVVGLLENSLLQGKLLIGEANFTRAFPAISGYRYFLIDDPENETEMLAGVLENRLGDIGLDVADARNVLSGLMAVQNTYLRTFQSLGGLGLLLGTVGLAIAQLRNVLERRKELATMRAIGFTRQRLASLVMGETASLLAIGIGCGVLCAIVAVLPHALSNGITPPIVEPVLLVAGIFLFGLVAGLVAAGRVVRMRLLESLRGS